MRNNVGDLARLLLFILAITFMKVVSISQDTPDSSRSPQHKKEQVGRGADTTADKKLASHRKAAPLLSDI